MKKLVLLFIVSITFISCYSIQEVVDVPLKDVYIQVKETKYQVYRCSDKFHYILKLDKNGRVFRQRVYVGIK
jgi:hypothetical protein